MEKRTKSLYQQYCWVIASKEKYRLSICRSIGKEKRSKEEEYISYILYLVFLERKYRRWSCGKRRGGNRSCVIKAWPRAYRTSNGLKNSSKYDQKEKKKKKSKMEYKKICKKRLLCPNDDHRSRLSNKRTRESRYDDDDVLFIKVRFFIEFPTLALPSS